jgi:hypothetical protein
VTDPAVLKDRVAMTNRYPVLLMVVARKTAEMPVFQTFPQQSDYVPRWGGQADPAKGRRPLELRLRRLLLETWPSLARFLENYYLCSWFNWKHSLRNRQFFKPVKR